MDVTLKAVILGACVLIVNISLYVYLNDIPFLLLQDTKYNTRLNVAVSIDLI